MRLPDELARLLAGQPEPGAPEQGFPFVTVDPVGYPHVALLSRAELAAGPGQVTVLAAVASPRTRANLARQGLATLIAVADDTAHYAKLQVIRTIEAGDLLGCELAVIEHKADSLGIPLTPITFTPTPELAAAEDWHRSGQLLRRLAG